MKMAFLAATGYFKKGAWDKMATASQTKASSKLDTYLENQPNNIYGIQEGDFSTNKKNQELDDFEKFTANR
jgi:hypothetical protein